MGSRYGMVEDDTTFWLEFQVCNDGMETPAPSANSLRTFSCFGALPFELRLKIWEYLLQPRIVIAACFEGDNVEAKRKQLALRPRRPAVPALLHVSRETRELALRHYELTFAWRIPRMLARPRRQEARVWFDFGRDALLLLGELEPYDANGINAPMVYFLRREDLRRVRHVACAFEELRFSEHASEQVFGCLFHVIDSFPRAGRLLITSTPDDLEAHPVRLLPSAAADNVVQKIWRGWINGTSVVTSSLANKQILMVREGDLFDFVAETGS